MASSSPGLFPKLRAMTHFRSAEAWAWAQNLSRWGPFYRQHSLEVWDDTV